MSSLEKVLIHFGTQHQKMQKKAVKKLNFLLKFACDTDLELKIFVASSINDNLVLQDKPKVQIMLAGLFFGK